MKRLLATLGLACTWSITPGSLAFQEAPAKAPEEAPPAEVKLTADQLTFFESKIRPILVKHCYDCHSADAKDLKADLLLDSRQGIQQGGTNGPAIVPGSPEKSLLILAIRQSEPDLKMPPKNSGGKLAESVIRDFETWVKMGAPDPRDNGAGPAPKKYDTQEARKWWAYQPVQKPEAPSDNSGWSRGDIDRFVLAGLKAKDIKPVADADKTTLIRRVYIDLIGLPPTPANIDEFLRDGSDDALAKVVDGLLARPQFGERWGRHWLDVARFAESSGKDSNIAYPHAWRYRDYVIAAFNKDKPFDQFIREQIAGDLLPAASDAARAEQQIATGFLAIGPKSLNEQANRQFALDVADEQVDATSQAFIGLTVSCARCHDHRFDPISQRDYYATAGIFLSTQTNYGTLAGPRNNHESDLIELPRSANLPMLARTQSQADRERLKTDLAAVTKEYEDALAERREAARNGSAQDTAAQKALKIQGLVARKSQIESQLESFDESGKPKAFAMGVEDRPAGSPQSMQNRAGAQGRGRRQPSGFERIADSPLFFRGEMTQPRDRVPRGVPEFLAWSGAKPISDKVSGRKELADWLASKTNPLTARVTANRLWHWLFGQGIVVSVDNFGTMGEAPSNQALLDHLASRLVENGWSVKKTIREIVLSRTYQLASTHDERSFSADPQNSLMWRHSKRRLDAECIRDAILASSGQISLDPVIGSAVALAGDGPIVARRPGAKGVDNYVDAAGTSRSVYLPVPRDMLPDAMDVFDAADPTMVTGARETTNVPSQALFLLNSDFVRAQAKVLAQRAITAFPAPAATNNAPAAKLPDRAAMVFRLTLGRPPNPEELKAASRFFQRLGSNSKVSAQDAWTDFCLAIYNTAEFRYLN